MKASSTNTNKLKFFLHLITIEGNYKSKARVTADVIQILGDWKLHFWMSSGSLKKSGGRFKIPRLKWKWKHNPPEPMGHREGN